jgi:hypothetical protein
MLFMDGSTTRPRSLRHTSHRDAPCLYCGFKVHADDVRAHSLMYGNEYGARSYFYRTHRTCADADETRTAMDGFILDMIARVGN